MQLKPQIIAISCHVTLPPFVNDTQYSSIFILLSLLLSTPQLITMIVSWKQLVIKSTKISEVILF